LIDAIDSYIRHVRLRMGTINPSRHVRGPIDAEDWPPKQIEFETFYLLTLSDVESPEGTIEVPIYTHMVQWTWAILGADLGDGTKGRNRGNRYRTDYQLKDELRRANNPNHADKVHLSVGNSETGTLTYMPSDIQEQITWSKLHFNKQTDKPSGLLYVTATVYITQITEPITA